MAAAKSGIDLIGMDITDDCCLERMQQTPWWSDAQPMPNTSYVFFDRAIELNPKAKFLIRLYLEQPDKKPADYSVNKTYISPFGGVWQGCYLIPGVPPDPLALLRGPLESSLDRESAIGNAPGVVPGPVARL